MHVLCSPIGIWPGTHAAICLPQFWESPLAVSGYCYIPQKWIGKLRGSILWWEWGHSQEFRIELSNHNAVDEEWSTEEIECPAPAGLSSSIFGAKLKQSQTWNWKIKCNGPQKWKPLQQSEVWSEKKKHLKLFLFRYPWFCLDQTLFWRLWLVVVLWFQPKQYVNTVCSHYCLNHA